MGKADDRLLMRAKGMLAFVISAEPRFLGSLAKSVGSDAIRAVLRTPQISFYHDNTVLNLE
jgi:hypothetical protein